LQAGGAEVVAAVVIGRRLDPHRDKLAKRLWDQLGPTKQQAQPAPRPGDDPQFQQRQALRFFASCCLEDPGHYEQSLDPSLFEL
jgi:hypothetical protein